MKPKLRTWQITLKNVDRANSLYPADEYTVTAYSIGAVVSTASTGTTATVYQGHGFKINDKFIVNTDATKYRTVTAKTDTTLTLNSATVLTVNDKLVNLGPDTGASSPNYDGSRLRIYSDPTGTPTITVDDSRVTCNEDGEYSYWHYGSNFWELVRDTTGTPTELISGIGTGDVINVWDYGTQADGVTDDAPAIQTAIDSIRNITAHPSGATGSNGGCVMIPGTDNAPYVVNTTIDIPYGVSLVGDGYPRLYCTSALDVMINIDSHNGILGNRLGILKNLYIDGNNLAEIGVYVGLAVLREFESLHIRRCTDAGIVLDATQNSTFINLDLSDNGSSTKLYGAGLRMEGGAGNCTIIGGQIRDNIPHNVRIMELDVQSAYSTYFYGNGLNFGGDGPTGNAFFGTIIEDMDDTDGVALVYASCGRDIKFVGNNFSMNSQTVNKPLIKIDRSDFVLNVINDTKRFRFLGCQFNGTAAVVDAFWIMDTKWHVIDACTFQNIVQVVDWDPLGTGNVESDTENLVVFTPSNIIISATDRFNPGTAIANLDLALKSGQANSTFDVLVDASNSTAVRVGTVTDAGVGTVNLTVFPSGRLRWSTDVELNRKAADELYTPDDFEVQGRLKLADDDAAPTELTIASDIITITGNIHTVDTEADAGTDNLVTINGGKRHQLLILSAVNGARDVVVKATGGNIILVGATDFTMDTVNDRIVLLYDGTNWLEIMRSSLA